MNRMMLYWSQRYQYKCRDFQKIDNMRERQGQTQRQREIFVYTQVNIYSCISNLFPLKRPRNNEISVAMSTASIQILVSKYYSLIKKESGLFGEAANSGAGTRKTQNEPVLSHSARKQESAKERMGTCRRIQEPT